MKKKWYINTWFIALMAALWPIYLIPPIISYFLIRKQKKVYETASDVLDLANRKAESIINEATLKVEKIHKEAVLKVEHLIQKEKSLKEKIDELTKEVQRLQSEIEVLTKESLVSVADTSAYEQFTSEEIKNKLQLLKLSQQDLIKQNLALEITSLANKKVVNNNAKQILRCFNTECENIISNLSARNVDSARGKITKSFELLNKIFETDGVALSKEYLESKLEELNLVYTYELKKEQEREIQKAIKEQLIDEEKARKELERERQKLEKEETHFRNEIKKMMTSMQRTVSEVEKNFYIEQIQDLQEKLEQITKDKEDIINREQNTRAGFVYIISNIGAFGENVYKIGMTRRLDPMERINELGDASVPFKFDVHAIIFTEDAPALESKLQERLSKYELNKVNPRKEFFKVPLSEIQEVVRELHSGTINWIESPSADEYRESLRRINNNVIIKTT